MLNALNNGRCLLRIRWLEPKNSVTQDSPNSHRRYSLKLIMNRLQDFKVKNVLPFKAGLHKGKDWWKCKLCDEILYHWPSNFCTSSLQGSLNKILSTTLQVWLTLQNNSWHDSSKQALKWAIENKLLHSKATFNSTYVSHNNESMRVVRWCDILLRQQCLRQRKRNFFHFDER